MTDKITIAILALTFLIYFLFTRKAMRELIRTAVSFQLAGQKTQKALNVLSEQYRQLANINQALRDIQKTKGKKIKN